MTKAKTGSAEQDEHRNLVALTGRLAAPPLARILPSGDELLSWRLVVRREGEDRRARVDTLDCVAWTARLRRQVRSWAPGDLVEVEGALRRRFWRGANGAATSRCEVEVSGARRLRRATMAG